jgi:hypothetical protein
LRGVEEALQEWPAPAATGPRTVTIGELCDSLRPLDPQVVNHLPLGDVEAQAKLVVEFHANRPQAIVTAQNVS